MQFMTLSIDPPTTTDKELDEAWLSLGRYKWRLRQLAFDKKSTVKLRQLYPALTQANKLIDEIWDEILRRQVFPAGLRRQLNGQLPPFNKAFNPLRWDCLPMIH